MIHQLPPNEWDEIMQGLYDAVRLRGRVSSNPSFLAWLAQKAEHLVAAAVCLDDTARMLCAARLSLGEALACWKYYSVHRKKDGDAAWFAKFYYDYCALTSVAATNHLGAAVEALALKKVRRSKGRWPSAWEITKKLAGRSGKERWHELLSAIFCDPRFKKMKKYRNDWVHNQPARVAGTGVSFGRGRRWQVRSNAEEPPLSYGRVNQGSHVLFLVASDTPDVSIDVLLDEGKQVLGLIGAAADQAAEAYHRALEACGATLEFNDDGAIQRCSFKPLAGH